MIDNQQTEMQDPQAQKVQYGMHRQDQPKAMSRQIWKNFGDLATYDESSVVECTKNQQLRLQSAHSTSKSKIQAGKKEKKTSGNGCSLA